MPTDTASSASNSAQLADNEQHIAVYDLLSGPETTAPGSFTDECRRLNASVVPADTLLQPELRDVLQDHIWPPLKQVIQSRADTVIMSQAPGLCVARRERTYTACPTSTPARRKVCALAQLAF